MSENIRLRLFLVCIDTYSPVESEMTATARGLIRIVNRVANLQLTAVLAHTLVQHFNR